MSASMESAGTSDKLFFKSVIFLRTDAVFSFAKSMANSLKILSSEPVI